MIPPDVFLDTAFALALANPHDLLHDRAINLADLMEAARTRFITTRVVLMEIGNALAKVRYRAASITLLNALETDPNVEIISMTDDLYHRAFQLYHQRPTKEWGLFDGV